SLTHGLDDSHELLFEPQRGHNTLGRRRRRYVMELLDDPWLVRLVEIGHCTGDVPSDSQGPPRILYPNNIDPRSCRSETSCDHLLIRELSAPIIHRYPFHFGELVQAPLPIQTTHT